MSSNAGRYLDGLVYESNTLDGNCILRKGKREVDESS
jgi:hypothetical protein